MLQHKGETTPCWPASAHLHPVWESTIWPAASRFSKTISIQYLNPGFPLGNMFLTLTLQIVPFQTSLIKVMNVFIFELVNSEFHNIFQLLCHLSYKKVKLFQNLTQLLSSPVLPLLWSWAHSGAESLEEGMFAQWPKLDAWFTLSRTSHVDAEISKNTLSSTVVNKKYLIGN